MPTEVFQIPGQPEKVAARAAVRLAWQGDVIEPVSATEFVWKPTEAERKLFHTPRFVEVECLPSPSRSGHVLVRLRWPRARLSRPFWGGLAGIFAAHLVAVLGLGLTGILPWIAVAAVPLLVGITQAIGLQSGGLRRIRFACQQGGVLSLQTVEKADRFLELEEADREAVLTELRRKAADLPSTLGRMAGRDERSAATLLGWPLWHIAYGVDPVTGRPRVARGWYAKGQFAEGFVAVGQVARGYVAAGQLAIGAIAALGQAAFGGLVGLGQVGIGGLCGLGQVGAGLVAAGMGALGVLILGMGLPVNPVAVKALIGLAALGTPLSLAFLASFRTWLRRAEGKVLEEELALAEQGRPQRPDEHSLSRSSLQTAPAVDERSLSVSEEQAEEETETAKERLTAPVEEEDSRPLENSAEGG